MTAEALKALLSTPIALFALMLAASLANAFKQLATANQDGGTRTLADYLAHWKETVGAVLGNVIAFAILIYTDQLNFASALGIGYGVNSAVDLLKSGGRSGAMKQGGFAHPLMLVSLVVMAVLAIGLLQGCAATPASVIQAACQESPAYRVERCASGIADTYKVFQKRGLDLVQNPVAPADVKAAVKAADKAATKPVTDLLEATQTYMLIRDEYAAGNNTAERLASANAHLLEIIQLTQPLVNALVKAIGG